MADVYSIVCLVVFLCALIYSLFQARRLWRNEPSSFDTAPTFWVWGGSASLAGRRQVPLLMHSAFVGLGIFVFLEVGDQPDLGLGLLLIWLSTMLLNLTIALFNRPKMLVPPHLRSEPGLVRDVRARRANR